MLAGAFLCGIAGAQPASLHVEQLSPEGNANTDVKPLDGYSLQSSDGKWVVFWSDADTNGVPDLYSVSRFGGTPVRLSALRPLGSAAVGIFSFVLTPDNRRVIFELDQETLGREELWSVPIEGPATAAVKLSPSTPLGAEVTVGASLSADGQFAEFWFNAPAGLFEIWSAPTDGSSPAFKLHPDFPPGASGILEGLPAGNRVVFQADLATAGQYELWSVPFDGSEAPVRLNGSLVAGGNVNQYGFSQDLQRVFYIADQRVVGQFELYSVPVAGPFSAAVRLNPTLPAFGDVTTVSDVGDPTRILFLADSSVDGQIELWSVPIDGPATSAVKLNGPMVVGGNVLGPFGSVNGIVSYIADAIVNERYEMYLVPIAGPSTAGFRVNANPPAGGDVTGGSIADLGAGPFVLLLGDLRVNDKFELFVAPADGSAPPQPLFTAIPDGQGYDSSCGGGLAIDPPALLFCADALVAGRVRLFRAPLDHSTEPQNITGGTLFASDVTDAQVDPTGTWVAFRADKEVDEQYNLYRTRADGTGNVQRVHATPLPAGADIEGGFDFTPDGAGLVYRADHDVDEKFELWISDGEIFRADFEWGDTSEWSSVTP